MNFWQSSKPVGPWSSTSERTAPRSVPLHRCLTQREGPGSLADDLDQDALLSAAVELAVEDLLPGSEVELPACDRDHDLAAHHLPLEMCNGVVLAGVVVPRSPNAPA